MKYILSLSPSLSKKKIKFSPNNIHTFLERTVYILQASEFQRLIYINLYTSPDRSTIIMFFVIAFHSNESHLITWLIYFFFSLQDYPRKIFYHKIF